MTLIMPMQFDNTLSDKFREVFENHTETYNSQDWESMKLKLSKNKKKTIFIFSNIAKAASILLIVGLTALTTYTLTMRFQNKTATNALIINNAKNTNLTTSTIDTVNSKNIAVNSATHVKLDNNYSLVKASLKAKPSLSKNLVFPEIERKNNFLIVLKIDTFSSKIIKQKNILINYGFAVNEKPIIEKKERGKKLSIGAKFSTFYNYSDAQTSSNANAGVGIISEYKLTKNISLNSGIIIAKNTLDNQGGLNGSNLVFAAKEADYVEQTELAANSTSVETVYDFFSIDIPLNLYFYHKNAFVSGGFSSYVYFNENIENIYTYTENSSIFNTETGRYDNTLTTNKITSNQSSEAFKVFDFAKMLNLSVGYKIKQKKGSIIIEPYAKIPISELTSNKINFGLAGVSFRYNF